MKYTLSFLQLWTRNDTWLSNITEITPWLPNISEITPTLTLLAGSALETVWSSSEIVRFTRKKTALEALPVSHNVFEATCDLWWFHKKRRASETLGYAAVEGEVVELTGCWYPRLTEQVNFELSCRTHLFLKNTLQCCALRTTLRQLGKQHSEKHTNSTAKHTASSAVPQLQFLRSNNEIS